MKPKQLRHTSKANQEHQWMANLAMELGVAGAQVLQEDFGFTQEQVAQWFDTLLARAEANRAAGSAAVLKEWGQR